MQIRSAEALERSGRFSGALSYYRDVARDASGTAEGRLAAARVIALGSITEFP